LAAFASFAGGWAALASFSDAGNLSTIYSAKGEREREVSRHRHLFHESSDTVAIIASTEDSLGTSGFSRNRGEEEEARYSHDCVDGFACEMGKR
jgi:thiamine biosynthesis lipoprotein ApbE